MTRLLAFDTATERLHVGLSLGGETWLHESEGGARASAGLIPQVRALLRDAGVGLNDLDAIAFGRGPGAFTGLRTACAVAQGLAIGAAKPLVAIDTLMAVADDARLRSGTDDLWVAMDARMDEIYAAHYRRAGSSWLTIAPPALHTPESLWSHWRAAPPQSVAGSALAAFGPRLQVGAARTVADARPGAQALLACALTAWGEGLAIDPAKALPHYVRDRVAFTTAEREAAKSGRVAS